MLRRLKKLIAVLLHKHEYEIIHRGRLQMPNKRIYPVLLERCYCGSERCRMLRPQAVEDINPTWYREELARKGESIPTVEEMSR